MAVFYLVRHGEADYDHMLEKGFWGFGRDFAPLSPKGRLKGCVLRCKWCYNPESQEYRIQEMTVQGKPKTIGRDVTVAEVMETVEKDRTYYHRSGGESLCQPEFARDLLRAAKAVGINTAMESMACAKWEVIREILPWLDHYLCDVKHMDSAKHKQFTGKGNELMLENVKKIASSGQTRLSIRVPVIPTFNATLEEIRAIARFADTLPGVEEIYLLSYHRLGQDKYAGLGRTYELPDILPPEAEHMERLKREVESCTKLRCHIGG